MKNAFKKLGEKIKRSYEQPLWKWVLSMFLIAVMLEFLLEILGRRSILKAVLFVWNNPLVYIYNVSICFFTLSFCLLVRRRVFLMCLVLACWMTVGVCNCVVLGYRITPFSFIDITMISDVFSMMDMAFQDFDWEKMTDEQLIFYNKLILEEIELEFDKIPTSFFENNDKLMLTIEDINTLRIILC